jgi:hypothetical protein
MEDDNEVRIQSELSLGQLSVNLKRKLIEKIIYFFIKDIAMEHHFKRTKRERKLLKRKLKR